jgi:hypothetical protein
MSELSEYVLSGDELRTECQWPGHSTPGKVVVGARRKINTRSTRSLELGKCLTAVKVES